MKAACKVVLQ